VAIQPLIIEYDRTKPNEEIENEEIESDPKRKIMLRNVQYLKSMHNGTLYFVSLGLWNQ
jgi:hypothetical protein